MFCCFANYNAPPNFPETSARPRLFRIEYQNILRVHGERSRDFRGNRNRAPGLPLGKSGKTGTALQFYSYRLPHQDPGQHAFSDVGPVQTFQWRFGCRSLSQKAGLIRWIASVVFGQARRELSRSRLRGSCRQIGTGKRPPSRVDPAGTLLVGRSFVALHISPKLNRLNRPMMYALRWMQICEVPHR